jgi:hypothetical protein
MSVPSHCTNPRSTKIKGSCALLRHACTQYKRNLWRE